MKDTNRRIDLDVEEFTRRICFESKPLWERVWIKFKRWFWNRPIFFQTVFSSAIFTGLAFLFVYLINYLTTIL